jgi:hypothetical protein
MIQHDARAGLQIEKLRREFPQVIREKKEREHRRL